MISQSNPHHGDLAAQHRIAPNVINVHLARQDLGKLGPSWALTSLGNHADCVGFTIVTHIYIYSIWDNNG